MNGFERLRNFFVIPQAHRKEFNERRTAFNQNTLFYTCLVLTPGLLLVYLIGFLSRLANGQKQEPSTVALYAAGISVCLLVFILLWVARKQRKKGKHVPVIVTDLICSAAYTAIILLFLFSYNHEILHSDTLSIARIDVFIILLFTIVFLTRLPCVFTLSLQTAYTLILDIWLTAISGSVSNYMPCVINLNIAFLCSAVSTCLLWATSKHDFTNEKNMESLLSSDFLTRLRNRHGFDVFLESTWKSSTEKNSTLTMFMIDIDNFKKYNDTFGHVEGDNCLRIVAKSIATSLRRDDFAARYGGEEFVVLMSGCSQQMAMTIAQRILDKLKTANVSHPENVVPYVTVSIGVATASPAEGRLNSTEFVRNADAALYTAKKTGRNKIVFFEEI